MIEYNVMKNCPKTLPESEACDGIWPWCSDNTVVQFNVVSDHKSIIDGYAYVSYRTSAEVKSSITSRSTRRTFWRISGGTSLDTCSLSRTFASHLCSFSEGTCHPLTGSLFRLPAFPLGFSFRQLPSFFRFLGFRLLRFFRFLLYFFLFFRFCFGLDNNGFFILLGKHLLFYRLLHFRGNGLRHHIHFHQRGISTSKCIGHFTQHYRHTVFILLLRQSEANQYQQENERYMYLKMRRGLSILNSATLL